MPKTIILTGGTGLIGKALHQELIRRGDEVILFVRNIEKAQFEFANFQASQTKFIQWNAVAESGEWTKAIAQADAVIHLAGVPVAARWNNDYKKAIYDSRILSTRYLAQAISQMPKKPSVFICASAVGYYGNQGYGENIAPLDESSPPALDFLAQVCVDWEKEAFIAESYGVRTVAIRTGVVLSTKGGALEKMLPPFKLFAGGPLGNGKQWVSWIHLDDEVNLFLFALDNASVKGSLNATSPNPVMMNTFAQTLGETLSRPSLFPVPKSALEILFGEAANVIAEGQRVLPKRAIELGFQFQFSSLKEALKHVIETGK